MKNIKNKMSTNNKIRKNKCFKNKILTILIGIILAFICLEIFFQTTSFIITQMIKYKNYKQIENKFDDSSIIKILCIGESTTFKQYPNQLREYLKKHSDKVFEVIDIGRPGAMLTYINSKIESDLKRYNPDIVITMMGINQAPNAEYKNEKIYNKHKFKTVELLCLLTKHLKICFLKNIYSEDMKYSNIREAKSKITNLIDEFYERNKNCKTLEEFNHDKTEPFITVFQDMLDNPYINIKEVNHYIDALESILRYWKNKEYPTKLFKMLRQDIGIEIKMYIMGTLFSINQFEFDNSQKDMVYSCTKNILEEMVVTLKNCKNSNEINDYCDFTTYNLMNLDTNLYKNYILQLYDFFWENNAENIEDLYLYLKENNINVNKPKQSKNIKIINEITGKILTLNDNRIKKYYLEIAEKIINRNMMYICMDYPTMSVNELKDFFKDTPYYSKIIFVSNEENFNKALKMYSYDELFYDNFGWTFGHCTDLGNTIIAENVGKVILDVTDNRNVANI